MLSSLERLFPTVSGLAIAQQWRMARTRIGISGWRYEPWRKIFYPADLTQDRELEFASRAFPTIEINGSFYSLQSPQSYAAWYRETPADFVFSVKGPRYITHILRLKDVAQTAREFLCVRRVQPARKTRTVAVAVSAVVAIRRRTASKRSSSCCLATPPRRCGLRGGAIAACTAGRCSKSTPTGRCVMRSKIRHESFATPGFVDAVAQAPRRARGGRYRRKVAVSRRRHQRLHVSAPARRRRAVRERLHRCGTRSVGGAHPRVVARPRATRCAARRAGRATGGTRAMCSVISTTTSRCARPSTRTGSCRSLPFSAPIERFDFPRAACLRNIRPVKPLPPFRWRRPKAASRQAGSARLTTPATMSAAPTMRQGPESSRSRREPNHAPTSVDNSRAGATWLTGARRMANSTRM